jgi:hypothetical protein
VGALRVSFLQRVRLLKNKLTYRILRRRFAYNIRAENATFNGILIGSVVMTEILVWTFDAVPGGVVWDTAGVIKINAYELVQL